jgi:hypothetical protein
MGFFGSRKVNCPKDEWTTLISNFGTGIPAHWTITFRSKNGEVVDGLYREKRYAWIFPQDATEGQLLAQMTFQRYWINAIYSLKVRPSTDVIAEIGRDT